MIDDAIDARHREAIAQRVLNGGYKESDSSMKEHAFNEEYRSMRWFRDVTVRSQFEDAQKQLYCRSCETTDKSGHVRSARLYIAIEKDMLGNVPAVSHLTCHNCGWEVYVNLPRDPRQHSAMEEMAEALRRRRDSAVGMANLPSYPIHATQSAHIRAMQAIDQQALDPEEARRFRELLGGR